MTFVLLKIDVHIGAGKVALTGNASASRSFEYQHLCLVISLELFIFSCSDNFFKHLLILFY